MREPESAESIRRACKRLLDEAGVEDALPTPVEQIVSAADLARGTDDLFADDTLDRSPGELGKKIRALRGKVRALLDRRERKVYVNPEIQLEARRNFHTLHEVGHDILDWQRALYFPDDDFTLSWRTKVQQEREANYAGAELLFQGDFFSVMAEEFRVGMPEIADLSRMIGASTQAGLRRFAERDRRPVAAVVLERSPASHSPLRFKRREAMASPTWQSRFPSPGSWPKYLEDVRFPFVRDIARLDFERPPIAFTTELIDHDGARVEIHGELTSNSYNVLVLLWIPQREWLRRRRAFALSSSGP